MAAAAARATVAARVAARSAEQNTMSCGSSPRSCFSYWAPCTFCSIASCRDEWWGNVVHLSFEKCDKSNRARQHLERFTRKDSRGVFPVSEKECKRSPSALLFRETVQTQYHRFFIYARTTSSPMVPPPPLNHPPRTASRTSQALMRAAWFARVRRSRLFLLLTLAPSLETEGHGTTSTRAPTLGGWPQRVPPKVRLEGEA